MLARGTPYISAQMAILRCPRRAVRAAGCVLFAAARLLLLSFVSYLGKTADDADALGTHVVLARTFCHDVVSWSLYPSAVVAVVAHLTLLTVFCATMALQLCL